jgi:hypothetical protein
MGASPSSEQSDISPLQSLADNINEAAAQGLPPVHLWNPSHCGDIGLRIAGDGAWYVGDSPILRGRLVKLFASVLRRDDDGCHYLVTPVEKISVNVTDAPFLAVEMAVAGEGREQRIVMRTNLDDWVEVDHDHPLRFVVQPPEDALKPYVLVRGGLEALLSRALVFDLIECAVREEVDGQEMLGVWSNTAFFPIAPASALEPSR